MPNLNDVFIGGVLYESDNERDNALVEQAMKRAIRRLVKESISSRKPSEINER